jgi:hypothetical protein
MIIRIRLKAHPDKYVGREDCTYALTCDAKRGDRRASSDPTYYTDPDKGHMAAHWFVAQHRANTWTKPANIKRTLSTAADGWGPSPRWASTTWTAYEVEHVDTGVVEPLDVFLMQFRTGKAKAEPKFGRLIAWRKLRDNPPVPPAHEAMREHAKAILAYVGQPSLDADDLLDLRDRAETIARWARKQEG